MKYICFMFVLVKDFVIEFNEVIESDINSGEWVLFWWNKKKKKKPA